MDLFDWMLRTCWYVSLMVVILPAQKVAKCWIEASGSGNEGVLIILSGA